MKLSINLKNLAAKSSPQNRDKWLPFYIHSLDTAEVIDYLCKNYISDATKNAIVELNNEQLQRLCKFIALVHDIGKMTVSFQYKIKKYIPNYELPFNANLSSCDNIPHARMGEAILCKLGIKSGIAAIVGSHHGKPQDTGFDWKDDFGTTERKKSYYGLKKEEQESWEDIWKEWVEFAIKECDYQSFDELPEIGMESQMLLTGMLIMADWIASNETYFPLIGIDDCVDIEQRQLKTSEALEKTLNLPHCWEVPYTECFDFEERFSFSPNIMQKTVINAVQNSACPGIFILEAEMGSGKTEAALAAAEILASKLQLGGLFFGLPTQATSNGIFTRLLPWAEKQSKDSYARYGIKLAHGNAELNEDYRAIIDGTAQIDDEDKEGLVVHQWFNGSKKSLLSTFVVGTVDQVLMASLKQKHLMLRHLGLSGKVVIIDECHAYDAYMNKYLDRTLSWLGAYKTPVIILSATLPASRRAELIDAYLNNVNISNKSCNENENWRTCRSYPLLTWTDGSHVEPPKQIPTQNETKVVQIEKVAELELCSFLNNNLNDGGCAGVIVNTVAKAQKLAQSLKETLGDKFEIQLFHAQFLMPDRIEREKKLIDRVGKHSTSEQRNKLIVVGTQVLEQSLDLDFDLMVSELCPMDLLLQRMGRLHRHSVHNAERPLVLKNPRFAVLQTDDGELDSGSRKIYGDWLLLRTQERLTEQVRLPDDIPELVQDVYQDPDEKMLSQLSQTLRNAWEKRKSIIEEKKGNAENYCIKSPERKSNNSQTIRRRRRHSSSITGLLNVEACSGKAQAMEMAVRDSDPSIDVLVMIAYDDGTIHFLPWQYDGIAVPTDEYPDEILALKIAKQKLRLPRYLCMPWIISNTISELETMTQSVATWQMSKMLKGELFLLLNKDLCAILHGVCLTYDKEVGLIRKNEEKEVKNEI